MRPLRSIESTFSEVWIPHLGLVFNNGGDGQMPGLNVFYSEKPQTPHFEEAETIQLDNGLVEDLVKIADARNLKKAITEAASAYLKGE